MAVTAKTGTVLPRLMFATHTVRLRVSGMTCGNCQRHVQKALEGVRGVKRADVDLATGEAVVVAKPGVETPILTSAVAAAGYTAEAA